MENLIITKEILEKLNDKKQIMITRPNYTMRKIIYDFSTNYCNEKKIALENFIIIGDKNDRNYVNNYYKDKKFHRFQGIEFSESEDINNFIKPLLRNGKQYGWYVYNKRVKADFGGIHIPLEESRKRAEEFIKELKNRYIAKHLVAGNSLES